ITDGVDLPALHAFRRHQHSEIGFAAGAGEGTADIGDLAVRTFDTDDEHMLGEPALLLAELAGNPQRETFFCQQRVTAIARADAPDGVILRIMTNEAALDVEIGLGMQTARTDIAHAA